MELEVYQQADRQKDQHWWFLGRRKIISSILSSKIKNKNLKVLDAGCGAATSLPILRPFGKIIGIDKSPKAINFCRKKDYSQLARADVASLPFKDKSFDLIAALDLLEHVKDDRQVIQELARVCQKGSWLIVTVPAFSFLWGENDIATHHFRRYQKMELKNKVEKSGFEIKKLSYFNFFLFPLFLVWHVLSQIRKKWTKDYQPKSSLIINFPGWLNKFFILLFSLEAIFLPVIDFPFGLSLICLAQKK